LQKKGSPKPPPKNFNPAGWTALRALQPAELLATHFGKKTAARVPPKYRNTKGHGMPCPYHFSGWDTGALEVQHGKALGQGDEFLDVFLEALEVFFPGLAS